MFALVLAACATDDGGWGPAGSPEFVENPPDVEGRVVDTLVADGADIEFFLSRMPVPGTIEVKRVWPNGEGIDLFEAVCCPLVGDYSYDPSRNSVVLLDITPDAGDVVRIEYRIVTDDDDLFDR